MYYISDNLQVSTPTLIEILCHNGYDIIKTEKDVTITTPYKSKHCITYEEVVTHLEVSGNRLYKHLVKLQNDTTLELVTSFVETLRELRKEEHTNTIDTLLYYKAIALMDQGDKQIISLVKRERLKYIDK